jgi:YD repeat-containing protein
LVSFTSGNTTFTYQYNANNWLTNRTSSAKGATGYGYDAVGKLTSIAYQHSGTITCQYDKLNRLTNMVDAAGTNLYAYDGAGQLLSETGPGTGVSVSNTYTNRLRQASTVKTNGVAAWAQSYYYDPARRLTNVASGAGTFTYRFAPGVQGLPSGAALPNGASITNSYDPVARLKSTVLRNSQLANLDLHQYGYNLAGQRTWLTNTFGDYRGYGYDNAGQLKSALGSEAGGASRLQEQFGYAYDAGGNLARRTDNALTETFTVNSANELGTAVPTGTLTLASGTVPSATNVTVSGDAGRGCDALPRQHLGAARRHPAQR